MIAYIKGEISDITEDNLVLESNGIGYNIKISAATAAILPALGEIMKIYTYTNVREDAFLLYGFLTKDDLGIFKKLITVSGIGPKVGLSVLSALSADELRFAIAAGDAKTICKAPGVGKKTAERVILELKDKISIEDAFINASGNSGMESLEDGTYASAKNEAVEALTALGYSSSEALRAVKQVAVEEGMNTEEILKQALKNIF